jgi:hypothetical protein
MTPHIPRRHVTDHNGIQTVRGLSNMAAVLGRSERTIRRYIARLEDPLPAHHETPSGRVWIELETLIAWASRNSIFGTN